MHLPAFDALADSYIVKPNSEDSLRAVVELTLDQALDANTPFRTRSVGGVTSTIDAVRCTRPQGIAAVEVTAGNWNVPEGCLEISWSISFRAVGDRTYELSKQQSLYHPKGWWFLNESGSLLRNSGQQQASVCAVLAEAKSCTTVSPLHRAPTFLVFGKPEHVFDWQGKPIEVYTGYGSKYLELQPLLSEFTTALGRINRMTRLVSVRDERSLTCSSPCSSPCASPAPSPLQFVWLGISSEQGAVGGAAGDRAFLSNFRIEGDAVTEIERTRLLIISGHEYIHMIGVNAGAFWATETLATYYGYKAVAERPGAQQIFQQMAYADHPQAPLMVRGAGLWRELDEAIDEATQGGSSLSDLLVHLTGTFAQETLPAPFLSAITQKIGKARLDDILATYF